MFRDVLDEREKKTDSWILPLVAFDFDDKDVKLFTDWAEFGKTRLK